MCPSDVDSFSRRPLRGCRALRETNWVNGSGRKRRKVKPAVVPQPGSGSEEPGSVGQGVDAGDPVPRQRRSGSAACNPTGGRINKCAALLLRDVENEIRIGGVS